MKHLHDEVRVEAPVEHIWDFYRDTSYWPDYMPRARFSDFSGPVDEVGTTYVETIKLLGFEMKQTSEVVEVEPLRLIHEHTDNGPMDIYMRFEPDGDSSRLVVDCDYEIPGKLPGYLKDLASKGWIERQTHQMLVDFKALAEARIPPHA